MRLLLGLLAVLLTIFGTGAALLKTGTFESGDYILFIICLTGLSTLFKK